MRTLPICRLQIIDLRFCASSAMMLPIKFTLNALLVTLLGFVFLIGGVYSLVFARLYMLAFGCLMTALGCICCGLTDGFTDSSPSGFVLKRIGAAALFVGLPVLFYSTYRLT